MLIFEHSHPGRRASAQAPLQSAPADDIPQDLLRATAIGLPEVSELDVVRHYTQPVAEEFQHRHPVLPPGLVHHEVQPPGLQQPGHAAPVPGPPSPGGRRHRSGFPGQHAGTAIDAERSHRHGGSVHGAHGRRPRRVRRHGHDPRLSRRPGRHGAARDHRPGRRPRHQPGHRQHVRLHGARDPHRPPGQRGPGSLQGRRRPPDRRPDADQPLHPGRVRADHRRHPEDRARGGRPVLLRRRQPERHPGSGASRRHGLRRDPHEPAQDLLHPPRRRRARRRPGGRVGTAAALPAHPLRGGGAGLLPPGPRRPTAPNPSAA
jgi:hypothetical protein